MKYHGWLSLCLVIVSHHQVCVQCFLVHAAPLTISSTADKLKFKIMKLARLPGAAVNFHLLKSVRYQRLCILSMEKKIWSFTLTFA